MGYLLWIPITLVYNLLLCFATVKCNGKGFWVNYFWLTAITLLPTWSLAAYYSRNLVFDAMLYNSILITTSALFLSMFGHEERLTPCNWLGVGLVVGGLILTRLR